MKKQKRGCYSCGSSCGVPDCKVCEHGELCARCKENGVCACVNCGSTNIEYIKRYYATGVETETTNDAGWQCGKCGAFESECEKIIEKT